MARVPAGATSQYSEEPEGGRRRCGGDGTPQRPSRKHLQRRIEARQAVAMVVVSLAGAQARQSLIRKAPTQAANLTHRVPPHACVRSPPP